MQKEKLLISACLMGQNVKYNGGNNRIDLAALGKEYILVPFCPEVEGGLPTPRAPSEITAWRPLRLENSAGQDVTHHFMQGARKCLKLVRKEGITKAVLKSKSPSCGVGEVYDGTFRGKLVEGDGVTVALLKEAGVLVVTEKEVDRLL